MAALIGYFLIFTSIIGSSLSVYMESSREEAVDIKSLIKFDAYTALNPNESVRFEIDAESIIRSGLNLLKPTTLALHGLWGDDTSQELEVMKNAKLEAVPDGNVVAVDYSSLIKEKNLDQLGETVASLTAQKVTDLLEFLEDHFDFNLKLLHLVGFDLGSHIAGLVGRNVQKNLSSIVPHITALDPLSSAHYNGDSGLSPNDADYVEVIHTNTGKWGLEEPCGHADYYPNGGSIQPGCKSNGTKATQATKDDDDDDEMLCSHRRSYHLLHDMWRPEVDHEFIVLKCTSHKLLDPNGCRWLNIQMGSYQALNDSLEPPHGIFYVETNDRRPFGKGAFQIVYW